MAEGRSRANWDIAAGQIAHLLEPDRDRDKQPQPFDPRAFNPWTQAAYMEALQDKKKARPRKGSLGILKAVFVDRKLDPETLAKAENHGRK